jgi:hypothetical protein
LKIEQVDEKLRRYKSNWLWHVTSMNNNRMLKIMRNCVPNGLSWLRRPLKSLLDEAETGLSRHKSWHDDNDDDVHLRFGIITIFFCPQ